LADFQEIVDTFYAVLQSLDPVFRMICQHRLKTVLFSSAYWTWFGAFVAVNIFSIKT